VIDAVLPYQDTARDEGLPVLQAYPEAVCFTDVLSCQDAMPSEGMIDDLTFAVQEDATDEADDVLLGQPPQVTVLALQIATQMAQLHARMPEPSTDSAGETGADNDLDAHALRASRQASVSETVLALREDTPAAQATGKKTVLQADAVALRAQDSGLADALVQTGAGRVPGTESATSAAPFSAVQQAQTNAAFTDGAGHVQPGGLAQIMVTHTETALPVLPERGAIPVPLEHPEWPQALGRQVLQLFQTSTGEPQLAQLRLDPPELGPLHIALQIKEHVAHVVCISAHLPVRDAVTQALPQLQEQLAQAGISLGQADVHDQHPQDAQGSVFQTPGRTVTPPASLRGNPHAVRHPQAGTAAGVNLIDTFV